MYEWILPLIGLLVGIFAAITGVGGGVLFVPILTLLFAFAPSPAIGTSMLVMVFGGVGATIGYARQKKVYFKAGALLGLAMAPGAVIGAYLTEVVPGRILGVVFGLFLTGIAIRMILSITRYQQKIAKKTKQITCEEECFRNYERLISAFTLSFFAGILSGLLAIGSGVFLVPILLSIVSVPVHIAIGTSMFLMGITSIAGSFQFYRVGNIDFVYAILLGIGALIGTQIGAYLSKRIRAERIQLLFAIALFIASLEMLLKFL